MNIAVYTHYFTPEISAPSTRVHDLAREWIRLGHKVQVITCLPNHPTGRLYPGYRPALYQHEVIEGINVHRHWTLRTPNRGFLKKSLGHLSYLPAALLISNRHIDPPDVVIGTSPTFLAAAAAARTAQARRIPFVMEVRDLWPAVFTELKVVSNYHVYQFLERVELGLYARATKIVTVTESFRRDLLSRRVPGSKVVTVANGADLNFWVPRDAPRSLLKQLGVEGCFVVMYIGTHGISQGLGAVLDCAERLRDHADIRFIFVGDGADKGHLLERTRERRLANVQFIDPVDRDHIRDYYAMADLYVLPLRNIKLFDAFIPSKTFEMMAMARPILAAVRGESADILRRSGGAIVVEPEDSAGLAAGVMEMYSKPNRRSTLGQAGRRFVVENYSRAQLAGRYAQVLERATLEGRAS